MKSGKVFLVGAGPGDIGLITVKGLEAIKRADVILYDRLANPKLLDFAGSECELIYCGKLPDRHVLRQENINDFLTSKALEGKIVVRLKGGDPGVFGRVGEEAHALAQHQIPFEIVPGISSGIAAPLYAGIPVTHRDYAESFAVVTAHDQSPDGKPLLDWEGLVRGVDTIAFYMGVKNLPYICESLALHGKPASTPVILIQWGTFGRQKTLQGTLADISEKVETAKFSNPAIILVGEVISLREKISWFEKKPLYSRQILLARTGESKSEVSQVLQQQGADVIEFPKWKKTRAVIDPRKAVNYDKILFLSPESVAEFFEAVIEKGMDIRKITADLFGASSKSVRALNERGLIARRQEEMPSLENLLIVGDNRTAAAEFKDADYIVTSTKELDQQYIPIFKRMLQEAKVNTVVFPSQASVGALLQGLRECQVEMNDVFDGVEVVCMGPQTFQTVKQAGFSEAGIVASPTKEALLEYLAERPIQA